MVMKRISASRFKAQCLSILDEVAAGEEVVVTKRGRPVARLVSVEEPKPLLGSVAYAGTDDEIWGPSEDDWDAESA